jgi:hypothetical protein
MACARTFAAVLRDTLGADRASSDFLIPRTTLGDCLPTPAAGWLARHGAQIRLRTPARALCATDTGWQVRLSDGELPARSVVLAVPPSNAARLLRTLDSTGAPEALARQLDAFAPVPIATTYAAWPSGVAGALPPMMMIPQPESPGVRAESVTHLGDWVFDRGEQLGHRIVSVVASAVQLPPTDALDTITRSMATSAAHALGLPAPAHAATVIERRATFACVPALWVAGDFTEYDYPATIESAVRSGLRAGAQAAGIAPRVLQAQAAVSA